MPTRVDLYVNLTAGAGFGFGPVRGVVDSGAPCTCVSRALLTAIKARTTGEYHHGNHGGIVTHPGYNKYYEINTEDDMTGRHKMKVSVADESVLEYDVCLILDWLKKANPIVDHRTGRIVGRVSKFGSWA